MRRLWQRIIRKLCPDGPEKLAADWPEKRRADTITFQDFILDKEKLANAADSSGFIEICGVYIRASDNMDHLLAPGKMNPNAYGENLNSDNAIPLLIDDAPLGTTRDSRAGLLAAGKGIHLKHSSAVRCCSLAWLRNARSRFF